MNKCNKKIKIQNINYKKYFVAIALVLSLSGLITIVSSQSIRAQISNLYNRQNDQVLGVTALMSAVVSHDIEGVRFFSKAGKSLINQKNLGGATALHLACRNKDFEIAKILIDNGADVNALDNEKWTPLMRATLAGDEATLALLLDNGAKAGYLNSAGESAIYHAALSSCNACLNIMISKIDFTKEESLEVVKKQVSDAFVIAANHDNNETQVILENLLDLLDATSVANAKNSGEKVFNFDISDKKSKKFAIKKGKKAINSKGFILKKPVESDIKINDKIKPVEALSPQVEVLKPQVQNNMKKDLENAVEQNQPVVYNKKPVEKKFKKPEVADYVPLGQETVEEIQSDPKPKKVFKFMQEAGSGKKDATNATKDTTNVAK